MDWTILWWVLAILIIIAGLAGTVVPALPGVPLVFLGLLIGALVVLIREVNPTHPDAVFAVILLASILAPLIDHAVIAWNVRKRASRHV